MPKDLPDKIQKVKWKKAAKDVETWEHWYGRHISKITKKIIMKLQYVIVHCAIEM